MFVVVTPDSFGVVFPLNNINNRPFAGSGHMVRNKLRWDENNFQNKGKSGWTGKSSFVLDVPLGYVRPSVIYSVPCDRILQNASCLSYLKASRRPNVATNISRSMSHL